MTPAVYYNEIDPFCIAWLRELMAEGVIPLGDIDDRSIWDVLPTDLRGYTHCHFFAGIGGWAYAARLAGWPDDRPLWTGSCPCQPFSAAGQGKGIADERHLWPAFHWLIDQCRPPVIAGEQVDAALRHGWVDLVQADLEGSDYRVGWADLPAASVGAPHLRQRLWWVAESNGVQPQLAPRERSGPDEAQGRRPCGESSGSGHTCLVADDDRERREGGGLRVLAGESRHAGPEAGRRREVGVVGDPDDARSQGLDLRGDGASERAAGPTGLGGGLADTHGGVTSDNGVQRSRGHVQWPEDAAPRLPGFWSRAEWHVCRDGKARPVEPGIFPLAHGVPHRVGTLRGAGNAIVPQVAAEFLKASLDD